MEYSICKVVSLEDQYRIKDFVHDHYLPDMPLVLAFGMENCPPPRCRTPHRPIDDFCLKAVDALGQIVGVAVNKVNATFVADADLPPPVKNMVDFFDFIEEDAELNNVPVRTIELLVLSVRRDWRGRGVAKRLAKESMKEARNAGFAAMSICCVSEYSARIARSLGWREHYRIALKDYPKLSGKEVYLKPVPPHEFAYFYITDL